MWKTRDLPVAGVLETFLETQGSANAIWGKITKGIRKGCGTKVCNIKFGSKVNVTKQS